MIRILRAFAWMRWRVLINSLERTGARDTLERFSIALEQIAPMIALLVLVPSALGAAALGAAAGYALSGAARPLLFEVVRYALLASAILAIVGPLAMPAAERTNAVRLLLLPISRPTLYVAQAASALADPWILIVLPLLFLIPVGLAAGGAFGSAVVAFASAVLLTIVLVGITSLATSVMHLIVRDRRRGELIALFFILVIPMIGMLPALVNAGRERDERSGRRSRETPAWVQSAGRMAPLMPTEMYVTAVRSSAAGAAAVSARHLAGLVTVAFVLHAVGLAVYQRLLDSPGVNTASRSAAGTRWSVVVPGVSAGTSAVALAQLRLALRTPRGRSILLSPLILVVMFGAMMYRGGGDMQFGFLELESGVGLAAFGGAGALLSILPIAMNQFAVDGAGLTLALLSPLSDRELLVGKAIGNGLIIAGPALFSIAGAIIAFPGGSPWLWLSVPLALAATYVLVTPAAAALSAIFPRAVDLNSIGRGSNAHNAAGFLGLFGFGAASAPCMLLVLLATRILHQPAWAPLFLLSWLGLTIVAAAVLFLPVQKLFARRRENLSMSV